mmetsp:Transcript_2658/g.7801  ORF Transcript_2658/g.7801 Transcript_2658/m.7801 type:complete len:283 (+) Transcript_2658:308-1156(+)
MEFGRFPSSAENNPFLGHYDLSDTDSDDDEAGLPDPEVVRAAYGCYGATDVAAGFGAPEPAARRSWCLMPPYPVALILGVSMALAVVPVVTRERRMAEDFCQQPESKRAEAFCAELMAARRDAAAAELSTTYDDDVPPCASGACGASAGPAPETAPVTEAAWDDDDEKYYRGIAHPVVAIVLAGLALACVLSVVCRRAVRRTGDCWAYDGETYHDAVTSKPLLSREHSPHAEFGATEVEPLVASPVQAATPVYEDIYADREAYESLRDVYDDDIHGGYEASL